jgi:hypothetical protein
MDKFIDWSEWILQKNQEAEQEELKISKSGQWSLHKARIYDMSGNIIADEPYQLTPRTTVGVRDRGDGVGEIRQKGVVPSRPPVAVPNRNDAIRRMLAERETSEHAEQVRPRSGLPKNPRIPEHTNIIKDEDGIEQDSKKSKSKNSKRK